MHGLELDKDDEYVFFLHFLTESNDYPEK
jgi:hypothetical protein